MRDKDSSSETGVVFFSMCFESGSCDNNCFSEDLVKSDCGRVLPAVRAKATTAIREIPSQKQIIIKIKLTKQYNFRLVGGQMIRVNT